MSLQTFSKIGNNVKVKKIYLLLIAAIVWIIAGLNVSYIGILSYLNNLKIINFLGSFCVFIIFWFFIFNKLVKKHTIRIMNFTDKQFIFNFFDIKSFLIMFFMIFFGVTIRLLNLAPEVFIAIFYTGLGGALTLAGIMFLINFIKYSLKKTSE